MNDSSHARARALRCIDEIPYAQLRGKRIFFRTSLNLPVDSSGHVSDVFRLKRALPTLEYLSKAGARTIVAGYFGRRGESLRPVAEEFIRIAHTIPVRFLGSPLSQAPVEAAALRDGECLILENLRQDPGEESKDEGFARFLASLADMFVSDALPEAHRDYASNVGIASFLPAYAGFLMRDEVLALEAARNPPRPSLAILGGAKFETKEPLMKALLKTYDTLFITGALANDIFKARGFPVGRSLVSDAVPDGSILNHPHFLAPVDVTVERSDGQARVKRPGEVEEGDKIVDIGPDSVKVLAPRIESASFIMWNGPTGLYEDGYTSWTYALAELIALSGAQKVIGGGDTIAVIETSAVPREKLGFLSTGGGAMLEYLLKGTLPGIEALRLGNT